MLFPSEMAIVCHEANRAYCETLGDMSQKPWDEAEQWQRDSAIKGVQFHIDNPHANAWASHDAWLKEKEETGWSYGPVKDTAKKKHPCFLPYWQLPVEQRVKDFIFRNIVHAYMDAQGEEK